jgi:hypothetical protein
VLDRKGWLLATELEEVRVRRIAADPQLEATFSALREVRGQLAGLAYATPEPGPQQAYREEWISLAARQGEGPGNPRSTAGT